MDADIQEIDIPNVYEYLLTIAGTRESYIDPTKMIAGFSPIYPDDSRWESVIKHDDKVSEFLGDGLKVIGLLFRGRCIGCCGYRMISEPQIVIRGNEVVLPYEMFMAIDSEIDIGVYLIYSAQMFIAYREDLKVVVMA
jgi:hypothetical protein